MQRERTEEHRNRGRYGLAIGSGEDLSRSGGSLSITRRGNETRLESEPLPLKLPRILSPKNGPHLPPLIQMYVSAFIFCFDHFLKC